MFKYSKDGISVVSVLDARRAKKSGLFPVKIQVIYNRKQKYYSTGQELSKEDWANLAESKSRRLSEIRSSVENSFSIIKSFFSCFFQTRYKYASCKLIISYI